MGGLGLIVALAWYFFAPQKATRAQVCGGVQTVDITVRGGYFPSLVRVEAPISARRAWPDRAPAAPRSWRPRAA